MAVIANGPGSFVWTDSPPDHNPGANGAKFAVNKNTFIGYEHVTGTTWVESGDRIQRIAGTGAPAYNPGNHQSRLVINQAAPTPGLYLHVSGTTWVKLNAETPQTLSLSGQDLTLSGGGGTVTLPSGGGVTFPLLAPDGNEIAPSYSFDNFNSEGMLRGSNGIEIQSNAVFLRGLDRVGVDANAMLLVAGNSDTGSGGGVSILSGIGAQGGDFELVSGDGEIQGGIFNMTAGNSPNGQGGYFEVYAGSGNSGGYYLARGGDSTGDESQGGSYLASGGDASGSEASGGFISIKGGNATGPISSGGSVQIQSGSGTNGDGSIDIKCPTSLGGGTIAIGQNASSIEIRNATSGNSFLRILNPYTPTSSADPKGSAGAISWDSNFIYVKTAAGWKRAALSTF